MGYSVSYTASGEKIAFIDVEENLTGKELDEIIEIGEVERIQTQKGLSKDCIVALNKQYFRRFPTVAFRLFGLYSENSDISWLKHLYYVEKLLIESSDNVNGIENLSELSTLKQLRINIYLLNDFGFLNLLPDGLEQLALETKSTALNLSVLERFQELRVLNIHGYKKSIDSLGRLPSLESLTLRGITPKSLDFINQIQTLHALKIHRGSKQDLSELYGNTSITALQLFRISHFESIEVIARLPNLIALELSQLPYISAFPDLSSNHSLRHISLEDMKSLTDFTLLEKLKSLNSISFSVCPPALTAEDILPILRNPAVESCSFYTASDSKNKQLSNLIEAYSKNDRSNFMTVRNLLFSNCKEI